jgi:hypothetical protein
VLYFKNKISNKGLEGLLYIDNENHAVAKAVMRIRGVLDISGIHEFKFMPDEKVWFPIRKNFKIVKGKSKEPTAILGGRIEFAAEDDNTNSKKSASDFTYLSSEMHTFDLVVNTTLKIKKSSVAIEVKDNANKRDTTFWNLNRTDSLDTRGERTYVVLDSIVTKENIENKIKFGRKVINGYLPFGPFDFDLRYLLSYNNFEGFTKFIGKNNARNQDVSYAKSILEIAEGHAIQDPNCVGVSLWVRSDNQRAINFYKKMGLSEDLGGPIPRDDKGAPFITMRKLLCI